MVKGVVRIEGVSDVKITKINIKDNTAYEPCTKPVSGYEIEDNWLLYFLGL